MSEDEARAAFAAIRWANTDGVPYCPRCGCAECYPLRSRPLFTCKACHRQFSLISNTLFANRKLPVRDILLAITLYANGANGHSANRLSRDLGCQYKTAFVLLHKIREAMRTEQEKLRLAGQVEIDGAIIGGHRRHENVVRNGRTYRITRAKLANRRTVTVARQRGGRTLTFVGAKESDALPFITDRLEKGTIVHADGAHAWDSLRKFFDLLRVEHKVAFSMNGACTNHAESYFARLRRSALGVYHRISGNLLGAYTAEIAWRIDNGKLSNFDRWLSLLSLAICAPESRQWRGYWGRRAVSPKVVKLDAFRKSVSVHAFERPDSKRSAYDFLTAVSIAADQEDGVFIKEVSAYRKNLRKGDPSLSDAAVEDATRQFVKRQMTG